MDKLLTVFRAIWLYFTLAFWTTPFTWGGKGKAKILPYQTLEPKMRKTLNLARMRKTLNLARGLVFTKFFKEKWVFSWWRHHSDITAIFLKKTSFCDGVTGSSNFVLKCHKMLRSSWLRHKNVLSCHWS